VIIGRADHPEVVAIKANADLFMDKDNAAIVISSAEEAKAIAAKKIGIVIQTTQKAENLNKILPVLAENAKEIKIYNTICAATSNRQKSAIELAEESDLVIVVGSKSSANTTHLAEMLSKVKDTIHIETAKDLEMYSERIEKAKNIGVTAGASTPESVINEVINYLRKENI